METLLEVQPKPRRCAKRTTEAQCGIDRDTLPPSDYFVEPARWDPDGHRERGLCKVKRLEKLLAEHFSRSCWAAILRDALRNHFVLSG
jgi:hypothetical protein